MVARGTQEREMVAFLTAHLVKNTMCKGWDTRHPIVPVTTKR